MTDACQSLLERSHCHMDSYCIYKWLRTERCIILYIFLRAILTNINQVSHLILLFYVCFDMLAFLLPGLTARYFTIIYFIRTLRKEDLMNTIVWAPPNNVQVTWLFHAAQQHALSHNGHRQPTHRCGVKHVLWLLGKKWYPPYIKIEWT